MRQIIRNRRIVTDTWQSVADGEPLPDCPAVVSLARWQAERDALRARGQPVGVRVGNEVDIAVLVPDLPDLALIALEFPVFKDGRALTQARLLRERHGFRGELRAVGDVQRDQLFFMERSGFDAFEVRADRSLEDALEAFTELTVSYQPAADEPLPLYRRGR